MKVQYIILDHGEEFPGDATEIETTWNPADGPSHADWAAEDCAEHEHSHCDGWEASWPLDFEIFVKGKSIGVFSVEREAIPAFIASKKRGEA